MALFQVDAKLCSPEVQGNELALHPSPRPQNSELHHLMVTAAKAAFDLHIPSEPLLFGEYEIQQSTSPHWFLYHLEEEAIINALQELPAGPLQVLEGRYKVSLEPSLLQLNNPNSLSLSS
ncbi:hypothetical protein llap_5701 [Limosa lapponica baueri]|uniref:Uncharacterized protein n=1 Tax=Limosa lapponica baueri TaxID=1758121 RepID=A0A2I0UD60_LIMLA|nr:hypothetical protein llap_5701 [Limosa lapponica baueri]